MSGAEALRRCIAALRAGIVELAALPETPMQRRALDWAITWLRELEGKPS